MKILLPTDHSEHSFKAICYTIELLGDGHEWALLNSYQTPHGGAGMLVKINHILVEQSKEELGAFAKRLKERFTEIDFKLYSEEGEVTHCVNVLSKDFDLVALGTTGASGLKEVLMGSVAAKVVEHSRLPVLAIPAAVVFKGFNTIAIADDRAPVNNTTAVEFIKPLLAQHQPEVRLVHVSKKDGVEFSSSSTGLDAYFSDYNPSYDVVRDADISKGLMLFNKTNNVDLLVMLQRKESALLKWLMVSTSEEMTMHAKVPILVLKD